jgi:cellulose synthase (UDP-forming)
MTAQHHAEQRDPRTVFFETRTPKIFLLLNAVLSLAYFFAIAFLFPIGNPLLFALLIMGEIFHVFQVLSFIYTIWETDHVFPKDSGYAPSLNVFITVAGEPVELVAETVRAAREMRYHGKKEVYVLNDGFVAKKDNWREIEVMARQLGARCITRTVPGGAKAGNINNALAQTQGELVAIFDADHVPHEDFLEKTVPYLAPKNVGFVQTPQFYKNFGQNHVTRGSWDQQQLFFGPICKGKNRLNAATMCGTNMVIRRQALHDVNGMCTESIAEDFVTGLFMHARGYRSVYVPEVLAEGLATEDLLTYTKQQFRWARGALDVIFRYNPLVLPGLTTAQRIQYLASASFYLSGIVIAIDALLPLVYFYTGLIPLAVSGMLLAAVFLPYMVLTLYVVQRSSNFTFTFPSLAFSMVSFGINIAALASAMTRRAAAFVITPKQQQRGNFIRLVRIHIAYDVLIALGIGVAIVRDGVTASLINNAAWGIVTAIVTIPFIQAALPQPASRQAEADNAQRELAPSTAAQPRMHSAAV